MWINKCGNSSFSIHDASETADVEKHCRKKCQLNGNNIYTSVEVLFEQIKHRMQRLSPIGVVKIWFHLIKHFGK